MVATAPAPAPAVRQFTTILSGDEEVPRVTTRAFGWAVFELYPSAPPPRRIAGITNAVLGSGTFTAANFMGPLARQPMSALVTALEGGNAYVNVHTARNPGGEIRGQIR
jgi:hypothetical protein